jgi:uncharacterized RDD family membrane protein YckC
MNTRIAPERDLHLQGHYAGIVTRAVSFGFDLLIVLATFALISTIVEYIVSALIGSRVHLSDAPNLADVLLVAWWLLYSAYPLVQAGRTLGMTIVGLRVVRADGTPLGARHAALRVLAFPLSLMLFWIAFSLIVLRRDRRALHDLVAGSAVVYAWDARAARLRFLAARAAG